MADNSYPPPGPPGPPPGDEPTPPRGELILPPAQPPSQPPVPRQPAEPAPLDPDEFRQFQEFKQFQELMRQQREQGNPPGLPPGWGPPPGPRPRQNPVKRALRAVGGKIATAVIVVLLLVAAGYLAIDYFLGGPPSQPPASQRGGQQERGTELFEDTPREAIEAVYDDVAQNSAESACYRFNDEARDQFTENFRSYGSDCQAIVGALNAERIPGMKDEYATPPGLSSIPTHPVTDSVTVSSCALGVQGGPLLGKMTVTRQRDSKGGNQWIVTAHEAETCTGVPSAPTTS